MRWFKKALAALCGFTLIVLIHELGHFAFCKLFTIDTPTFSIGFGPPLLHKKWGNTTFTIAALPLGGYVEVSGMDKDPSSIINNKKAFFSKPFYQQFLVLIGGILFNLLFSFIIYSLLWITRKKTTTGEELELTDPESLTAEKQKTLMRFYGNFLGPLGIFSLLGESINVSIRFYCMLLAVISFNLALINLIPLPLLDGGQLLLYTLQALHISISPATKDIFFMLSWIFILLFIAFMSIFDLRRLIKSL